MPIVNKVTILNVYSNKNISQLTTKKSVEKWAKWQYQNKFKVTNFVVSVTPKNDIKFKKLHGIQSSSSIVYF